MENSKHIITIEENAIHLAKLFESVPFDEKDAEALLASGIDINRPFYFDGEKFGHTFIGYAVECINLEAVDFCIKHGAELNYSNPDLLYGELLFDLQYTEYDDEIDALNLKITKVLLEHGADAKLIEPGEQKLFNYVYDKLMMPDEEDSRSLAYLKKFFLLLVAFDKSGEWKALDVNRIDEYDIEHREKERAVVIVDWNKEIVDYL